MKNKYLDSRNSAERKEDSKMEVVTKCNQLDMKDGKEIQDFVDVFDKKYKWKEQSFKGTNAWNISKSFTHRQTELLEFGVKEIRGKDKTIYSKSNRAL